jgi:GPH family glycoside/pentoside/hexuronide:cation symporter
MVGDICDADELNTGTRSEGSYYSVFWWFIKMGTALASFVTGALIVVSQFDEQQSAKGDALETQIESIESLDDEASASALKLEIIETANLLRDNFEERTSAHGSGDHYRSLVDEIDRVSEWVDAESSSFRGQDEIHETLSSLAQQSPVALFRLRLIEIGIPLLLCMVSIAALRYYPLSEERLDEIKDALSRRHSDTANS